jgi:hypothetical protein
MINRGDSQLYSSRFILAGLEMPKAVHQAGSAS